MRKIYFIVGLFIILFPLVNAIKSDTFIDTHSKTIFENCEGSNLYLEYMTLDVINSSDNNLPTTRRILELFAQMEPFSEITRVIGEGGQNVVIKKGGNNGYSILSCGDNYLDIDGRDWFWNTIQLEETPKIENTFNIINLSFEKLIGISLIGGVSLIGGITFFTFRILRNRKSKPKKPKSKIN